MTATAFRALEVGFAATQEKIATPRIVGGFVARYINRYTTTPPTL